MEKMNMIQLFQRRTGLDAEAAEEKLHQLSKEKWQEFFQEWEKLHQRRESLEKRKGSLQEFFAYANYLTDQEAVDQLREIKAEDPEKYQEIIDEYESWEPVIKRHQIQLELTDQEWQYLREKAAERGQSASTLLETFVKDFYGERRQGSDEEALAEEWFRRGSCNY